MWQPSGLCFNKVLLLFLHFADKLCAETNWLMESDMAPNFPNPCKLCPTVAFQTSIYSFYEGKLGVGANLKSKHIEFLI